MNHPAVSIEDVRDDIDACVRSAEIRLGQGFGSLEEAVDTQLWIERVAAQAIRFGLDAELSRLRELSDRADVAACTWMLYDIPWALRHGECPPEHEWKYQEYEHVIARGRACGLDVTRAEEAVARARRVQVAWSRGYDSPEHEEEEQQERYKPRKRTDEAASRRSTKAPADVDPSPRPSSATPPPPSPLGDPPTRTAAPSAEPVSLGVRYLELVEAALPAAGGGAKSAIVILAAVRQAVAGTDLGNLRGTRASIFDILQGAGVMPQIPSDRASRDAMNKTLEDLKLVFSRHGAAEWVFHIGDLRRPSPTLEDALRAEIRRLEAQRLGGS